MSAAWTEGARATAAARPSFGLGIAALRIAFGLLFLGNGLVKLLPIPTSTPIGSFLDSNSAYAYLEAQVVSAGHPVGPYRALVEQIILPNWNVFGPLLGLAETVAGALLVLGLLVPVAGLILAAMMLHLHFATIFNGIFAAEYPVYWVPLLALALTRAGRWHGLDERLARDRPGWWG
ncbi:hypothetical protein BH18CHL2_BH18CHL2_03580 [soil metagenome]